MAAAEPGRPARPLDVRGLATIDLAHLDAVAARLLRVDRKYLLTPREAQRLVDHLARDIRVLELEGRTAFRYASLYFDTAPAGIGESFRAAATGRRRRVKVRTRGYLDTRRAWLEVKAPTGRDESEKRRIELDWEAVAPGLGTTGSADGPGRTDRTAGAGSTGRADGPADPTALPGGAEARDQLGAALSAVGSRVLPEELRGVLRTSYTRTTLALPREGARVTVDSGLTWTDPVTSRELSTPVVVVETKSGQSPGRADRHLWRLGHRPARISKYAVGLSLMGLDESAAADNRWHRTLRTLYEAGQP